MGLRLLTVGLVLALSAGPAHAQDGTTSTTLVPLEEQGIVPEPNTGAEPQDAGDRGGALQLAVLGLVILGIAGAVVVVVRQSKRARMTG